MQKSTGDGAFFLGRLWGMEHGAWCREPGAWSMEHGA